MSILDNKTESFFTGRKNFNYTFKIINFRNILENKNSECLKSSLQSLFFKNFYIIVYPFGISGKSSYLELAFLYTSKIKNNYGLNIIFDLVNKDSSKKFSKYFQINSFNSIFYIKNFYILENLEKDGMEL